MTYTGPKYNPNKLKHLKYKEKQSMHLIMYTQRIKKRWVYYQSIIYQVDAYLYSNSYIFNMSNNYAQIPIIKFNEDHLQDNLSPLFLKQLFGLQDELVVYFPHFPNIIMLTKYQGMFF